MRKLLVLVVALLALLVGCTYEKESVEDFEIHIIDIGQGDGILLRHKDKTALIDGGQYKSYNDLKAYIQGEGVKKIDYIIATHPDSDHIGGLSEIIRDFEVGAVYMPEREHTTVSYKEFIKAIDEKDIPVIYGKADTEFTLTNQVSGGFLAPEDSYYDENNHYSLVLYLEYGSNSFLFMGDAEEVNEIEILRRYPDLNIDFIKLGHHGSSSSSNVDFITSIDPSVAAVSLGRENSYGHPHKEVIGLMETLGIPVYRTDEQGDIVFYCNENTISVSEKQPGSYKNGRSKGDKAA